MAKATKTLNKESTPAKKSAKKTVKKKTSASEKEASNGDTPFSLPTDLDTIPLFDAISYTQFWQQFNEQPHHHHHHPTHEYIRAFRIPLQDIKQLATMAHDCGFVAYRAYLGIGMTGEVTHPQNPTRYMKIMLVGVQKNEKCEEVDFLEDSAGNSCVFDLSAPCPNTCDYTSKLYQK